jgi:hypothetical protein
MRPDPWKEVRAQLPRQILVRVIDLAHRLQFFLEIAPTDKNLAKGASLQDGSTIVTPSLPGGRGWEDFQQIVYQADLAWSAPR